jgi:hypothetical protein
MIALQQIQYLQSSSSSASSELATTTSSTTSIAAAAAVATMVSNSIRINDTCDKCDEPQSSFISEKLMSKVGKKRQYDHGDKDDDGDDDGMIQLRDHVVYPVVEIIDTKNSSSFIIKGDDNYVNVIDDDDDDLCKIGTEAVVYGISADDFITKSVHDNNEHFIKDYINSDSTSDRNHKNLDDDIGGHNDAYGDDDVNEHTSDNHYKFDTDDHQIKIEMNSSKPKLPLVKSALKSTSSSINSKGFYSSSLKKRSKHNSSEKKTNCISQTSHVEATTTSNNNNSSSSSSRSSSSSSSSSSSIKLVDSMIDDIFGSKFKLKSKVKKSKATKQ